MGSFPSDADCAFSAEEEGTVLGKQIATLKPCPLIEIWSMQSLMDGFVATMIKLKPAKFSQEFHRLQARAPHMGFGAHQSRCVELSPDTNLGEDSMQGWTAALSQACETSSERILATQQIFAPRQAEWTPHGEVQGAELSSVPILAKLYLASPHVYLMADGLQVLISIAVRIMLRVCLVH